MTEYINYGETEVPVDIKKVEAKYGATYIGDFALKTKFGGWSESPGQVYWQPKPPIEGYSNYFAIFIREGSVYITSGQCIADVEIQAIRCGDEILYSRYRWDNRASLDGKCYIDGGRDYTKFSGNPDEFITLKLNGPEFEIVKRTSPKDYFETE